MEERGRYDGGNTTGFASPAADSLEGPIDLADILDLRRPNRYPVRVSGEALIERGILPGDILIADAAAPPAHGKVAIVMVHGEVLVAQLAYRAGEWWLRPGRAGQAGRAIPEDAEIWAIVNGLVRTTV
jgi:SOS-response transcriptional repressors (RecA-mediated autopeptidases)